MLNKCKPYEYSKSQLVKILGEIDLNERLSVEFVNVFIRDCIPKREDIEFTEVEFFRSLNISIFNKINKQWKYLL